MSQSHPVGDPQGPDVITVCAMVKQDGQAYVKFTDNQQKVWNSATPEAVAVVLANIGQTLQVKWQMMEGTLPDGNTYQSKYINAARLAPAGTPAQEYRAPYVGGSGGGGGSKGSSSKGDFRSREEIIACVALEAAASSERGKERKDVMETAGVYFEWIITQGKVKTDPPAEKFDNEWDAAIAANKPDEWGAVPAGPVAADPATFAGDDDIPF